MKRTKVEVKNRYAEIVTIADNELELSRGERIFTKEPETIEWIDGFEDDCIFFDIGANIGTFSLYAAKKIKNIKVYAFEPFALNYAKLNENININQLDNQITALPIAVNDKDSISTLNIGTFSQGTSGSQYNNSIDYQGQAFHPTFRQGCIGFSLDSLIEKGYLPVPDYIKIDVDGNEPLIINGAKQLLQNEKLKSILVELHEQNVKEIVPYLESINFNLSKTCKTGSDMSVLNYIFDRMY